MLTSAMLQLLAPNGCRYRGLVWLEGTVGDRRLLVLRQPLARVRTASSAIFDDVSDVSVLCCQFVRISFGTDINSAYAFLLWCGDHDTVLLSLCARDAEAIISLRYVLASFSALAWLSHPVSQYPGARFVLTMTSLVQNAHSNNVYSYPPCRLYVYTPTHR